MLPFLSSSVSVAPTPLALKNSYERDADDIPAPLSNNAANAFAFLQFSTDSLNQYIGNQSFPVVRTTSLSSISSSGAYTSPSSLDQFADRSACDEDEAEFAADSERVESNDLCIHPCSDSDFEEESNIHIPLPNKFSAMTSNNLEAYHSLLRSEHNLIPDTTKLPSYSECLRRASEPYQTFTKNITLPPILQPLIPPQCSPEPFENITVIEYEPNSAIHSRLSKSEFGFGINSGESVPPVSAQNFEVMTVSQILRYIILTSPEKALTLSEIYDTMANLSSRFNSSTSSWKNTVRHNLSILPQFVRVEVEDQSGSWTVDESVDESIRRERHRAKHPITFKPVGFGRLPSSATKQKHQVSEIARKKGRSKSTK